MTVLAITGGTGFVGSALIDRAVQTGHQVRALTRRDQPAREGVTWIAGSLDDVNSLVMLARGADAVIHVAGVVNAADAAGFTTGNVDGTRNMLNAAGAARFIHVSSLSAREPRLSQYGRSKAEAEALVTASDLAWTIVRPPAVYGPGDMEMRDLFRLAVKGVALLPPRGRLSVIEASDLARLLLALATSHDTPQIYEPDDGKPGGWSHRSFARAIGQAVGRERVLALPIPARIMRLAARGDRLVRRGKAKLTLDRVGYFCHPDWVVSEGRMPPPALWKPEIPTLAGLRRTAQWYRTHGLL